MADDGTSDGPHGVPEERIGLGGDLVRDGDRGVVDCGEVQQVVHVAVEDLLPLRECAPAEVFAAEVGRQGVDDHEPALHVPGELHGLVYEEDLVLGVEGAGDVDPPEGGLGIGAEGIGHLDDPLGAEGVLGIDDDDI